MATMVPPQKGVEYIFYVFLVSQANQRLFQVNPTLASGDVTVTTDGNAVTNLDTLPDVDPDGSVFVKVTVSATEMNGDNIAIRFCDAAGDEWCDLGAGIQTSGQSFDAMDTNIDDIETVTAALASLDAIADAVWDEVLTGAVHNAATSAGRRLRTAGDSLIIREETCQAGGGNAEVILDTGASGVDDFYVNDLVLLVAGTGSGQARHIDDYDHASFTCTVNRDWTTNPDETTDYVIRTGSTVHVHDFETEAKAAINAEVVDTLSVDTIPELSVGIPASTPTIETALMLLYMAARNKLTTTASELGIYNDAGTKIAKKALADDGTTYTEDEMASGA